MNTTSFSVQMAAIGLLALLPVAAGCSSPSAGGAQTAAPQNSAPQAATPQAAAAPPAARTACDMLTAAEMSSFLGTTVAIEHEGRVGATKCRYQPAGKTTPFVEVEVVWGDGAPAMMGARMASRIEPGLADRMAGLGDEASLMGPAVWVRTGEDLVMLTFTGVDDHIAVAKRIIATMRPRMGPSAQPRKG